MELSLQLQLRNFHQSIANDGVMHNESVQYVLEEESTERSDY